jgi:hypothetical protein
MQTYDPKLVFVTFGPLNITGFAEGSMIEVELVDRYSDKTGIDGVTTRARQAQEPATIRMHLMQAAPSNFALGEMHKQDLVGPGTPQPLLIKDFLGTELFAAEAAWIVKPADLAFGKEVDEREWTLRASGWALVS